MDPRSIEAAIARATPDRCRRIAIAAATRALDAWVDHPTVLDAALREVRNGTVSAALRASVRQVAEDLDDRYLVLHDDEAPGGSTPGWEAAFRHARAAAAVASALEPDPRRAAVGAVYEASYALDEDLLSVLMASSG